MPEYIYKAVDQNGIIVKNKVQDKSKQSLIRRLKINGFTPIDITQTSFGKYKKSGSKNIKNMDELIRIASESDSAYNARRLTRKERLRMKLSQKDKVTSRDVVVFTQNFYLLKRAGFNNIHALNTLIQTTENASLKGILDDILAGVEGGDYMYTTMEYYSEVFPYIYINLIKVGELSGSLDESLRQAVIYLDNSTTLTKKVRAILIPNIIEFVALTVLLFAGSIYLIPMIQGVFEQVGSTDTLPWYTIAFSNFLTQVQKVWWIFPLLVAIPFVYVNYLVKTPKGRYKWDLFKYKMPIFGKLIFAIDFSRLSNAMLLNLKNGMRIQEALEVSKNVIKNYVMLSMIESAINNIIIGDSWVKPFEDSGLASPMITEMLKIGMQTDLPQMMEKLVEYMDVDIDQIMNRIVKTLPQLLYSIVGIMIIFITIVVLVPCISVYMGTFLFSAAGV